MLRALPVLMDRGWEVRFHVADPSELADELRRRGYVVTGARREIGFSLTWLRHVEDPRRTLEAMPRWFASLGRVVRDFQPDVVHCNSLYTLADALYVRWLGRPVVLHLHEMLAPGWKGAIARRAVRLARIAPIAVSKASAERFAGLRGAPPPIVYESSPLPPPAPDRPADGPRVVGAVGSISPRKGTDLFVEAAARVLARQPDVRFELVGRNTPGPHHAWGETVLRRAREVGVHHTERDDVFARLEGWDALVVPSRFDPFPLVVLEALASRRPVIGARVDGIAEQLTPETGILVGPEDPGALAQAISDLLRRTPAERAAMGDAGRARVGDHFTPGPQAAALEAAYLRALDRDRPRHQRTA